MKRTAVVCMDSWAGRREAQVLVIGETPKRFRIQATGLLRLPRRELNAGDVALVPKSAVRFVDEKG